jgi:hypothetical protein
MYRSKAKATQEERDEIVKLWEAAQSTPVIAFSSAHALEEGGLSGQAWSRLNRRVHELALAHGLAEQEGFYGLDPASGEFLSQYPISERGL